MVLTLGEAAHLFNHVFALDCDLHVVPMKGWRRTMLWPETGLRWMMPSPNMPFPKPQWFIRARFSGKEPMSLKKRDLPTL